MYQAILFDLDGTLLDTLLDLYESTNRALDAFGYPKRTLDEIRTFVGNGIRLLIERAAPEYCSAEAVDALLEAFRQDYAQNSANHTSPYPGVDALLADLKTANIKTAIVSNKADFAVQSLKNNFFPTIDFAIGEQESRGIRKKPAPDMIKAASNFFALPLSDLLYVGDSEVDFETARACGIDCALVDWGFRSHSLLASLAASDSSGRTAVLSSCEALRALCLS